jgi:hypothetical protein
MFEFSSIQKFPFSGMERGPWTKISARRYQKEGPRAMTCEAGSINVKVDPKGGEK